ncbi:MAG: metal dependent phosphohydrolase [Methanohalophilus sp.]|nr:MAG: metal dependent phosphohydrolase [Methanohalophilus sp.]
MNQKNQNIGVSDWFTKKIKEDIDYPEQSNKTLDVFINDIIGILDNSKKLSDAADDIYDKLEKSEFINNICSDSRFPICSLFHHMKNTSAVATCILFQNIAKDKSYLEKCLKEYDIKADYAEKDLVSLLRIAALLHDIGKPRSSSKKVRYGPYYHHTTQTREILEHILENTWVMEAQLIARLKSKTQQQTLLNCSMILYAMEGL